MKGGVGGKSMIVDSGAYVYTYVILYACGLATGTSTP